MGTLKKPSDKQEPLITKERMQELLEEADLTAEDLVEAIRAVRAAVQRKKQ